MSNNIGTLGKKIAELRKHRGLTQDQLAEEMAVTPQAVSKWENDISCPDIMMLPQLAEFFNITVDELLCRESALTARILPEGERKPLDKMMLRVIVDSANGDKVRVNLPIPLLKMGLEIGLQMPQVSGIEALKNLDFEALIRAVDNGLIGELVTVDSADGDKVHVFVE